MTKLKNCIIITTDTPIETDGDWLKQITGCVIINAGKDQGALAKIEHAVWEALAELENEPA